jgi:hypothetical protein
MRDPYCRRVAFILALVWAVYGRLLWQDRQRVT